MASLVSCTAVPHPWFSDFPLKINYKETLLQGKIEIIWLCININKNIFFSVYRRNNYVLHKIIVQRHFWQKYFFQWLPNQVRKLRKFQGVGGWQVPPGTEIPGEWECKTKVPSLEGDWIFFGITQPKRLLVKSCYDYFSDTSKTLAFFNDSR